MARDARVIHYGEDIADYGGAFKLTKGLLEAFGRDRVFNTPISEAAICGTAVGAAMAGTRPVVELMYMDFALMASDQIANQAAKWHYMSGGQVEVPLVIRASVGAGKGYGGQHSPVAREHVHPHARALRRVPVESGGCQGPAQDGDPDEQPRAVRREPGPVPDEGGVPDGDVVVEFGKASIVREGTDVTLVTYGPAVHDCVAAAERLQAERGTSRGGHRPSEPRPARHGHGARIGPQDGTCRGRRSQAVLRGGIRQRARRDDPARGLRRPRCARGTGRRAGRDLAAGREPRAGVPAERRTTSWPPSWRSADGARRRRPPCRIPS